ncbi:ROK family protein [Endozoicomonas arenosclerae]|uniref:ROK family protein n=1 Tax=Endozoicomonas arenosclerae TaxID=1633495 RepID=UPI00078161DB|nr:ROK family protein [Endozoicomonas arenosclerae]
MYLAIDLGGTFVKRGLINDHGQIIKNDKVPAPRENISDFYDLIQTYLESLPEKHQIKALALSAPGLPMDDGTIAGCSALTYLHGPDIKNTLQSLLGIPVFIENDANCAALAEVWQGKAADCNDALFVVVGTGIGGAIIKNKTLHKGAHLYGGEFGMMIQYDHQTQSIKGFSELAATGGLVRTASERLNRTVTGEDIFQLAEQGNVICQEVIQSFYDHLAVLLTNLQSVYDPEKIIISGGITERPAFKNELLQSLDTINQLRGALSINVTVDIARFKNDANLIGAVYNAIQSSN